MTGGRSSQEGNNKKTTKLKHKRCKPALRASLRWSSDLSTSSSGKLGRLTAFGSNQ